MTTNHSPNTDLLFEHFATLATAPEGIARLRELILQLAVQGKLGTQDAGDETASVLLERIRKEKKQLIKDGKIRQEQPLEPIEIGEFQKNLPPKWQLSKLGEYSLIIMGQSPESKYYNEHGSGLPFYQGKSEFGKLFPKPRVWCETPRKIAQKNDILISVRAPVGPTNICPSESCIGRGLTALRSLSGTSHFFLLYSLRASEKLIAEMGVGSTFSAISKKDLDNFVIAIPPLTEQHRIVAKVDRLMALCDELEARQQQERAGCLRLGTASLAGLQNATHPAEFERQWAQVCDAFELILDCPENIERLRDSIVALACLGKLSEIWRTENQEVEPASHSLEKLIKDRKKKKFLKSNLKQHDFSDFPQIPDTWMWSTIEEVSERVTVGHVGPMMTEYRSTGIPFLRSQNVRKNYFDEKGLVHISQEFHDALSKSKIEPGDLVVVRSGNVGVCCVIPDSFKDANCSDLVIVKQPFGFLPRFGAYYVNSIAQTWVNSGKVGMALTHFNTKSVANLPIPLPPLTEQHRIVAKVDALMALCDALEARLKERAGIQTKFTDAVVKNVRTR